MNEVNLLAQTYCQRGRGSRSLEEGYSTCCRTLAAEGIVMLENGGMLPINEGETISVFGRVQVDTFFVGYGSGGDVRFPYKVNILTGFRQSETIKVNEELATIYEEWCKENPAPISKEWGDWPSHYEEMPLTDDIVKKARKITEKAIIIIGRAAGEDGDTELELGSYFLTIKERELLEKVTKEFNQVAVLINSGSIIDMSWTKEYSNINALLYIWQGGMETGNSVADILSGKITPSGKLADTIAETYEVYPGIEQFGDREFCEYVEGIYVGYRYFETFARDKVLYPFGYGLSYTDFTYKLMYAVEKKEGITFKFEVTNIGNYVGKKIVQIYLKMPEGKLDHPEVVLFGFAKTKELEPGETTNIQIYCKFKDISIFDEEGIRGASTSFVLEEGKYITYWGENCRQLEEIYSFEIDKLKVLEQADSAASLKPENKFLQMKKGKEGLTYETSYASGVDLKNRIVSKLPKEIPQTGDVGYKLSQVAEGEISLETFVAQLSLKELETLTFGHIIMNSPLGPEGNAGAFGGLTEELRKKGISPIITTDGPSGIRVENFTALLPSGVNIASSWNTALLTKLTEYMGREMKERGSDIILGPGLNIHRNPLCGRNFEYYSEDPVLSGYFAAAYVKGIQSQGVGACPKHFACNNQEKNRSKNDSRVTERALREIYLRGFEICIRESNPMTIMSSYNLVNGVWSHYHYDLCTTILREEWKFEGMVMTDWWMEAAVSPEFESIFDSAYRVRAQVDVLMPGGTKNHEKEERDDSLLKSYQLEGGITLGEIQRCAMNVIKVVLRLGK